MQAPTVESARTLYLLLAVASARYPSRFCDWPRSGPIALGHHHL